MMYLRTGGRNKKWMIIRTVIIIGVMEADPVINFLMIMQQVFQGYEVFTVFRNPDKIYSQRMGA
jgi:hypothetical protein